MVSFESCEAAEYLSPGREPWVRRPSLGKELLCDYINATVGFPKLATHTKIHAKTLHQMFGPNGNPTARNLFEIVVYLQHAEGVRFEVRSERTASRSKKRPFPHGARQATSTAMRH